MFQGILLLFWPAPATDCFLRRSRHKKRQRPQSRPKITRSAPRRRVSRGPLGGTGRTRTSLASTAAPGLCRAEALRLPMRNATGLIANRVSGRNSRVRATAGGERVHHVMTEHPGGEAAIMARQEGRQDLHAMSAAAVEAHQPGVLRLDQDCPDMRPRYSETIPDLRIGDGGMCIRGRHRDVQQ